MAKKYFIKSSIGGLWPAFGLIWIPGITLTAKLLRNFTIYSRKDSHLLQQQCCKWKKCIIGMLLIINNLFLRSNYTSIPPPVESLSDSTGLSFVLVWISDHFSLFFVGYFWFRRFLLLLWLESFQILFGRFYLLLGSYILWQEPWSATICSLVDHWSFILYKVNHKIVTTSIAMVAPSQSEPTINYPA